MQSALLLLIVKHIQIAVLPCHLFISAETYARPAPHYHMELVVGIGVFYFIFLNERPVSAPVDAINYNPGPGLKLMM